MRPHKQPPQLAFYQAAGPRRAPSQPVWRAAPPRAAAQHTRAGRRPAPKAAPDLQGAVADPAGAGRRGGHGSKSPHSCFKQGGSGRSTRRPAHGARLEGVGGRGARGGKSLNPYPKQAGRRRAHLEGVRGCGARRGGRAGRRRGRRRRRRLGAAEPQQVVQVEVGDAPAQVARARRAARLQRLRGRAGSGPRAPAAACASAWDARLPAAAHLPTR